MPHHRIRDHLPVTLSAEEKNALQAVPSGFVELPLSQLPAKVGAAFLAQQAMYQLAYDRAQAAAEMPFMQEWFPL